MSDETDSHELTAVLDKLEDRSSELEKQTGSPLTPAHIRYADRTVVVRKAVQQLDAGQPFDVSSAQALVARYFQDLSAGREYHDGYEPEIIWPKESELPDEAKRELTNESAQAFVELKKQRQNIGTDPILKGESEIFPEGIYDIDDWDAIEAVMYAAFCTLPEEKHIDVLKSLLDNLEATHGDGLDTIMPMINFIRESPQSSDLYRVLLQHVAKSLSHPPRFGDIYHDNDLDYVGIRELGDLRLEINPDEHMWDDPAHDIMWDLALFDFSSEPFFRALVRLEDEQMRQIVGEYIKQKGGYAETLNALRQHMASGNLEDGERKAFDKLGRVLLGFEPEDARSFHDCLEDVYKSADFSDYEGYASTEAIDREILLREAQGIEAGRILDIGSGGGRLAIFLAQETGHKVTGIDISEEEVLKAHIAAEAAQVGNTVDFRHGDMHTLQVESDSIHLAYTLGRTLTHDETESTLRESISEAWRVLEFGGEWILDLPHPNKGNMLALRQRSARVCASFGLEVSVVDNPDQPGTKMPEIDVVVDSPDGKNFYNRRVPQLDRVQKLLEDQGFEVEILKEAHLEGPSYTSEDRNVYIRARKATSGPSSEETERLSRLSATLRELSEQSQDDE